MSFGFSNEQRVLAKSFLFVYYKHTSTVAAQQDYQVALLVPLQHIDIHRPPSGFKYLREQIPKNNAPSACQRDGVT